MYLFEEREMETHNKVMLVFVLLMLGSVAGVVLEKATHLCHCPESAFVEEMD